MTLFSVDSFSVSLPPGAAARPILTEVSLSVGRGEIVGLVGESGSGKSTTARAALGLLPDGSVATGTVSIDGTDVLGAAPDVLRDIRRSKAAMVFQDPRAAVNPVRRVGDFLTENLCLNLGRPRKEALGVAVELLTSVGIVEAEHVLRQRPHELSGGMLQRVVIAAALTGEPELLLADEATSALDVSTQAEVLSIMRSLQRERDLGMLFITHDLHLAAAFCDRVYVMYAGRIVEEQAGDRLFAHPTHPYTAALLACTPHLDGSRAVRAVPGRPLSLAEGAPGCPFAPRCAFAQQECSTWQPRGIPFQDAVTACRRVEELPEALAPTKETA